jgi:aminopeptidase YwaD
VHPGADDNASGTAGVIELARWFGSQPKPKRGILFLAFAGEELGLLGSRYYVDHPALPLEKAVAMINMDMIGRLRDGKVYVGGARTGTTFQALLEQTFSKHNLRMDISGGAEVGSSDHASFTSKQVPVLFFFSGLHSDYHKPSDTWDKIDAPDAAELLNTIADITTALTGADRRPQFVRVEPPKVGPVAGGGPGYGAWFGSVPDFGEVPKGVKFADVTAGSPAAKAGLRGGDILIEFDGAPVQNLYDFTYALRAKKPGDEVTVRVLRGTETISAKVTLGQRPR